MSIHIDTIIAEVRNSLKQYDTAGLIDDSSIYNWTFMAMRRFGTLTSQVHETIVPIRNSQGMLPQNFVALYEAQKCDRGWVDTDIEENVLQSSLFWKERTERIDKWNTCKDCSKEYTEKVIVEKVYYKDREVKFCYKNPTYLKLSRHTHKDFYLKECKNLYVQNCPYEITINKSTVYCNFKDGEIYMKYFGLEIDEDGKPYIPETPLGHLETYITYHLKKKVFEEVWLNADDTNIESKIQFLISQEEKYFSLAMTDIKASTLTFNGFKRLEQTNRRRSSVFEI